ncbi:MAG TPA: hypothetical protein PK989_05160, partial [Anaerolineales bacterium]|nr:hypothetical protein [Anaerolineales bacterium]
MMPLGRQPTVTPLSSDGLPAQPQLRDSGAAQAPSFKEVLKVEEKKLQQTTNTSNAAALLATLQLPAIPAIEITQLVGTNKPTDPSALTIDSIQTETASPKQDSPLSNPQNGTNTYQSKPAYTTPISSIPTTTKAEQTPDAPTETPAAKITTKPVLTAKADTVDFKTVEVKSQSTTVLPQASPKVVSTDVEMPVAKAPTKPVHTAKAETVDFEAVEVKSQPMPVVTKESSKVVSTDVEMPVAKVTTKPVHTAKVE